MNRAIECARDDVRTRCGLAAGILLFAIGCGSGSSGFDPDPAVAERDAILASASMQRCTDGPGEIEICASGEPIDLPFEPSDGVLGIFIDNPIVTVAGPEGPSCDGHRVPCIFDVALRPEALPPGTRLLALIRPEDLSERWRTSTELIDAPRSEPLVINPNFVTNLPPGSPILTAVLIFPPGSNPPSVDPPGLDVDLLSELGAPRAGVVLGITLRD